MAAERTPSRRKQCIFRRTFQRFPFGKCERRSRSSSSSSSSSYDVHHVDVLPSKNKDKWSPTYPTVSTFNVVEQTSSNESQMTNANIFSGGLDDGVVLDPLPAIHPVSDLPLSPDLPLPHQVIDSIQIHADLDRGTDSAYSSVSYREAPHQRHLISPPSPSISSMETDVGVDPETGERAME
ncbi:uncharacterized protein LOC143770627 [Ranitomeya variabilis]|uniref:uncharacterized protein LOC143770627 n=1 Tax=Ranitomeya variabilis TaxID=490064 RepID=UPI0040567C86